MKLAFVGVLAYLFVMSIIDFCLCAADKKRAKAGQWRVKEATLLGLGVLGGCFGLWLGMYVFRHKTKHWQFVLLAPLECAMWAAGLVYFFAIR